MHEELLLPYLQKKTFNEADLLWKRFFLIFHFSIIIILVIFNAPLFN